MVRQSRRLSYKFFDAAASPVRMQILRLLHIRGPLAYSEIMESLGLDPSRDAGKFAYHLRSVLQVGLVDVDRETRKYILTDVGRMVVEFSYNVEDYARRKGRKLMVRTSRLAMEEFDRNKIARALTREAGVPAELAERISEEAEERLLALQTKYLTAPLIREFVNAILIEKGLEEYRHKLTRLGLPVYDVSQRIKEAGEFSFHAEAVHKIAGNAVLEEYVLLNVLPREVADAHLSGSLHICNTGYWVLKPNEVQHDLRIFLREGFRSEQLSPLSASLTPPKTFEAALLLTASLLKTACIEIIGGQSVEYFNFFLSPFVQGVNSEQLRDALTLFIFNLSRTPSSGGSILESTLGLELTMPEYLKDAPAIGPGGQLSGKYGDYEAEARGIFDLLIDIMFEDGVRKPVLNPSLIVKIRSENLSGDLEQSLLKTHLLAALCGTPYFVNLTRKWQVSASYFASGTRLASDWTHDWELDTLRSGNLDSVILNLPRISYEANGNDGKFFEMLDELMDLAVKALEIKYKTIEERLRQGSLPTLSLLTAGESYFKLENATRLISVIGLNEAVKAHTDTNIYENEDALNFAGKIIEHIRAYTQRHSRKPHTRIAISQTCDDYAAQRLAELDVEKYGWANVHTQGTKDKPYYTTMPIIPLEIEIPLKDRLRVESKLHPLLSGGHLLPIQLGEPEHTPEKLLSSTKHICQSTDIGFFTYTRNFTYCSNCRKTFGDFRVKCPNCKSSNTLTRYSRSSAKYSPLQWWTDAKAVNVSNRSSYIL